MLEASTEDLAGTVPLDSDALSRAYDLLDQLLESSGNLPTDESFRTAANAYCAAFVEHSYRLAGRYGNSHQGA